MFNDNDSKCVRMCWQTIFYFVNVHVLIACNWVFIDFYFFGHCLSLGGRKPRIFSLARRINIIIIAHTYCRFNASPFSDLWSPKRTCRIVKNNVKIRFRNETEFCKYIPATIKWHTLSFTCGTAVSGGAGRVDIGSSRALFTYGRV